MLSPINLGNVASVTGLSVAYGKMLTVNNTLGLSGTDGASLVIGAGGTLGSAAFAATSAFDPAGAADSAGDTALAAVSSLIAASAATLQPIDPTLTAFAALSIAADSLSVGTGADAFSQISFASNRFPAKSSSGGLGSKAISDYGLSLVDDADAATARATLGLGDVALLSALPTLDAVSAAVADVSIASHKLTNVSNPTSAQDAATKSYVDSVASGLLPKAAAVAATTANITLSTEQTIDGVNVFASDRVLVKNQTTGSENGIYECRAGAWNRAPDADSSGEVLTGMFVFVQTGTANGGSGWILTTPATITLGTTALTFQQFSGGATYSSTGAIAQTGTQFSISAGGITNEMLAGSIAAAKMVQTDIVAGNATKLATPRAIFGQSFDGSAAIGDTVVGGSGTTSTLTLKPTSGVGATGADVVIGVGNNGATEALRVKNDGSINTVQPISANLVRISHLTNNNLTLANQLVFEGDSLTFGYGSTPYPDLLTPTFDTFTKTNVSANGKLLTQMIDQAPSTTDYLYAPLAGQNIVVIWGGHNDMFIGGTPHAVYLNMRVYCLMRKRQGWKVIVLTHPSFPGFETQRNAWNLYARQNWPSFCDGLADLGADPTIGYDGASANTTYYQTDGHLTTAGYNIVAAIVKDKIDFLGAQANNQCFFKVHKASVDQTGIPINADTKLTFGAIYVDRAKCFDTSLSRWTPTYGFVHLTANVLVKSGGTAGALAVLSIFKNGAPIIGGSASEICFGVGNFGITCNLIDAASGNDYYELFFYMSAGSSVVVDGRQQFTSFGGYTL